MDQKRLKKKKNHTETLNLLLLIQVILSFLFCVRNLVFSSQIKGVLLPLYKICKHATEEEKIITAYFLSYKSSILFPKSILLLKTWF